VNAPQPGRGCDRPAWRRLAAGAAAGVALLTSAASFAEDPPPFRQGLWQFDRSVGSKKLQTKECTNPTEDMKQQNALLTKGGCKFTPSTRSGSTYTFSAECTINAPGSAPVTARSTSVLTVESEGAYRVQITTTGAGTSTNEVLVARRVGDCPK
jgi:uncharacterized protein DUF3617